MFVDHGLIRDLASGMKKKTRVRPLSLFPLHCVACGMAFHPKRADAKACSVTCRKRLQRIKEAGVSKSPDRPAEKPRKRPSRSRAVKTPA